MRVFSTVFLCALAVGQDLPAFKFSNICNELSIVDKECLNIFDDVVARMNRIERRKFDKDFARISQDASNAIQKCQSVLRVTKLQAQPSLPSFTRCYNAYIDGMPPQSETEIKYRESESTDVENASHSNEVDKDESRRGYSWRQWTRNLIHDRPSNKFTSRPKHDQVDEGPEFLALVAFIFTGMCVLILLLCYRLKWYYDIWYPSNERAHDLLELPNSIWTPAPPLRHHGAKKHQE